MSIDGMPNKYGGQIAVVMATGWNILRTSLYALKRKKWNETWNRNSKLWTEYLLILIKYWMFDALYLCRLGSEGKKRGKKRRNSISWLFSIPYVWRLVRDEQISLFWSINVLLRFIFKRRCYQPSPDIPTIFQFQHFDHEIFSLSQNALYFSCFSNCCQHKQNRNGRKDSNTSLIITEFILSYSSSGILKLLKFFFFVHRLLLRPFTSLNARRCVHFHFQPYEFLFFFLQF